MVGPSINAFAADIDSIKTQPHFTLVNINLFIMERLMVIFSSLDPDNLV